MGAGTGKGGGQVRGREGLGVGTGEGCRLEVHTRDSKYRHFIIAVIQKTSICRT